MTWACCVCGMPDGIERVGMARAGLTVCDRCVHALPAFVAVKAKLDDALALLRHIGHVEPDWHGDCETCHRYIGLAQDFIARA